MIRKLFLALPVLLLPQLVSAQTVVVDPQLEATASSIQATQTQILQQLVAIHALLLNGQTSLSPAQRAAMASGMEKAIAADNSTGKASVNSTPSSNLPAPTTEVATTSK